MERDLWPRLYHLLIDVWQTLRLTDVTYQPHIIALVFLWAALHDRPVCWACNERNWSTTTLRPATPPRTEVADSHELWGWQALEGGNVDTARKHARKSLIVAPFSMNAWKLFYCALRAH